jgi:hypothetical protein
MSEGLSQRAYAKHRGCNVSLVNRWAQAGRLVVGPDGKIDAEASDKALAASIDRTRGGAGGGGAFTQAMREETQPANGPAANPMTNAKVAVAVYDAKLRKLEYDREIGKVFEAGRVLSAAADTFATLRRAIQQIADRIASPVAAETDPRRVHALLLAEHNALLETMAAAFESLPGQFTVTRQ